MKFLRSLFILSIAVCVFGILLDSGFARLDPEKKDYRSLEEILEIENQEVSSQYERIKYFLLPPPNGSDPHCPDNSSYYAEIDRCKCFSGHFARYQNADRCVPERSGERMCEQQFGKYARYVPEKEACFCKQGYEFARTEKGRQCILQDKE